MSKVLARRWMLVSVVAFLSLGTADTASAALITFNTSDSQFDVGIDNQGWYATNSSSSDTNDNYIVGLLVGGTFRDFFTFDLSTLDLTGQVLLSATLELTKHFYVSEDPTETIAFYDVTTNAATLNQNGVNPAAFTDLGTGTTYGSFEVAAYVGSISETLTFQLNSAALTDISIAAGGFFSIGGSLLSIDPSGPNATETLFSSSGGLGIQRLIIETAPASVPEPTSLLLLGSGIAAVAARVRRRRKQQIQ